MSHDVFISYSTKDKSTADAVCSILEQNRIRCWIAPRDVTPGKKYAACIVDSIKQCKVMVVIFSSNSNSSDAVSSEIECAMKNGAVIIPVKIENATPTEEMEYYLSSRHWLDAITLPIEQHIIKLSDTIKTFLNPTKPDISSIVQELEKKENLSTSDITQKETFVEKEQEETNITKNIGVRVENVDNTYMDIDKQYAELLKIGLSNPDLRDYNITSRFYKLDSNNEFRKKYHIYANLCWNLIETIFDSQRSENGEYVPTITWEPVIIEENKLHFEWFKRNTRLFKNEFQKYVIEDLNNIELIKGNDSDLMIVNKKLEIDFPPEERKAYSHIESLIQKGRYKLYIARQSAFKKDIGYAFIYEIENPNAIWLDYMAIDPKYQNAGFGSMMFRKIAELTQGLGVFLEVEIPDEDDEINENQLKRIRFYEHHGAKKLNFNYHFPTYSGGFPMALYFKPTNGVKRIQKEQILQVIESLFKYVHSDIEETNAILSIFKNDIENVDF